MNESKFKDLYIRNNLINDLPEAITFLNNLEHISGNLDEIDETVLDKIIEYLVFNNQNSINNFIILMRYYRVMQNDRLYIHLTKYTGIIDVFENILKRLKSKVNQEIYQKITLGINLPVLGTSPYELPNYTEDLMKRLSSFLDEETKKKVLTGNNHGLSEDSQLSEKIEYENSNSLNEYLSSRHKRKVLELTKHYQESRIWFEQVITEEVIAHVKSNQEILSAKLENNCLYITKIPYDTLAYLTSLDKTTKRYHGCHCPFAREAILKNKTQVDQLFCYCSAGFAKFPFEVILGQKLPIKVLESIIGGSEICRFEINLENIEYKK